MPQIKLSKKKLDLANMTRTGLIIVSVVYTILSLIIIAFANPLVRFMGQDVVLVAETVKYIRLETVANIFQTLVSFVLVVLVTIKKDKYLYKKPSRIPAALAAG